MHMLVALTDVPIVQLGNRSGVPLDALSKGALGVDSGAIPTGVRDAL